MLALVKDLARAVPVPATGVALGLVALGNLVAPAGEGFRIVLALCSLALVLLVAGKIALFPKAFYEDMRNPVVASTFATMFMAVMQLSSLAAAAPVSAVHAAMFAVWCLAVVCHIALMVWFARAHLSRRDLKDVHATYFIAYVGIIVASLTSPAFGMEAIGLGLFWFGFACYAVLFVVVTVRYAKHEVGEAAKPTFCVYAAPMSLSLAGYLAVADVANLAFATVLAVLAQALFVVVLARLPKFLRLPFYPSYAAMTFPFVITATALARVVECWRASGVAVPVAFDVLAVVEAAFAAVMVLYVFARYLLHLRGAVAKASAERAKARCAGAGSAGEAVRG